MTSNMWMADGGSVTLAAGVNVVAWIAQFYGHGVHEGRAPALLDNLFHVRIPNENLARPKQDTYDTIKWGNIRVVWVFICIPRRFLYFRT